ncbi:MAG: CinA family protein [Devosia sp.]|uniref:CinA family protein n=1 Tax=Devosia sp. TaxID=1871048 RepID=UPI001A415E97|nr:CinA family protein [Devosia sp.]MBL8598715.1 CinA family protein [Devosia sp.]
MFHTSIIRLAETINHTLIGRRQMIVTAESCTGGLIAGALTDVPGSSEAVFGGYVTYANEAKAGMIGVDRDLIRAHGAVSEQVARAMAEGALKASGAAIAIAVTGIAGPGGGTEGKPVGLVHFAYADASKTIHVEKRFGDLGRQVVREETVKTALGLVLDGLGVARP